MYVYDKEKDGKREKRLTLHVYVHDYVHVVYRKKRGIEGEKTYSACAYMGMYLYEVRACLYIYVYTYLCI